MNGCQFQLPRFSAPAGPGNVSQEEWNRIFNSEEKRASTKNPSGSTSTNRANAHKAEI